MTKFRDECAIQAMAALIAAGMKDVEQVVKDAYAFADEMVAVKEADKEHLRSSAWTLQDRDTIQKAVNKVLRQGKWPEYKTEDDRGLERNEYTDFLLDVWSTLSRPNQG